MLKYFLVGGFMNIYISADTNVPYIVVDMLDLSQTEELENIISERASQETLENSTHLYFDKFLFIVPKADLIPKSEIDHLDEYLTDHHKLLNLLKRHKYDLFELPYFKKLQEQAKLLQSSPKSDLDQSDILLLTHYNNIKHSTLEYGYVIPKETTEVDIYAPLWKSSLKIFTLKISDLPKEIANLELESQKKPEKPLKNLKVMDVEFAGMCPIHIKEAYVNYKRNISIDMVK